MPIILGIILWERKFIFKQKSTYTFSLIEIIIITILLSILFEEGFPRWSNAFTKDYFDYVFYFVGALLFYVHHNRQSLGSNDF